MPERIKKERPRSPIKAVDAREDKKERPRSPIKAEDARVDKKRASTVTNKGRRCPSR
ncbi:hypothetical protein [Bacillus salipaludis]|uniref:hypothetical protein n=1 Tax=Bacillus salipaludis TaxID=2547811 RepID=UPI0014048913|nr:hypothetical protein [Bacillus salipaludis]